MSYSKTALLDKAVEITKEVARGGSASNLPVLLENIYNKLVELNSKINE